MRSPYGGLSSMTPPPSTRRHALQRVAATELDHVSYTGALGVALGKVHHAVRHVAAVDQACLAWLRLDYCAAACLLVASAQTRWLERHKLLERKAPQRAGGDVAGDLRRLDGDGAAAAAGVVQGQQIRRRRSAQPLAAIMAAARVSFSGASPLSSRQPRLNSGSPEVSMYSEQLSVVRCA